MSYAGHVLDMIRRDKENREARNLRRERSKKIRNMYTGNGNTLENSNLTVEELERIERQIKEREQEERNYNYRMTFVFIGIAIAVFLLLWAIYLFLI